MPTSIGRRVLLAVLLAAALIVILQVAVQAGPGAEAVSVPEPPLDSERPPEQVRRHALLVYLVPDAGHLPDAVAPVVGVLEDGGLGLWRAPPLPDGPEQGPWLAAGVILPRASLQDLTPVQLAALLSVCEGFSGGERLDPATVVGLGFTFERAELARLLRWLR